jgi:hypothetical protein
MHVVARMKKGYITRMKATCIEDDLGYDEWES